MHVHIILQVFHSVILLFYICGFQKPGKQILSLIFFLLHKLLQSSYLWFPIHTLSGQLTSAFGRLMAQHPADIKQTWHFQIHSTKLQIGNAPWLDCQQREPWVCDSTHRSSEAVIRQLRSGQQWQNMCLIVSMSDVHY